MTPEEFSARANVEIGSDMADAQKVLPLVKLGHKESYFANLDFEEEGYYETLRFIRDKPATYGGLYVEFDGVPAGCAMYTLRPFLGSRLYKVTYAHGIYIRTDLRATEVGGMIWTRMIEVMRAWGAPRSSRGIIINVMTGVGLAESDAVIRSRGGVFLGGNYFIRS